MSERVRGRGREDIYAFALVFLFSQVDILAVVLFMRFLCIFIRKTKRQTGVEERQKETVITERERETETEQRESKRS